MIKICLCRVHHSNRVRCQGSASESPSISQVRHTLPNYTGGVLPRFPLMHSLMHPSQVNQKTWSSAARTSEARIQKPSPESQANGLRYAKKRHTQIRKKQTYSEHNVIRDDVCSFFVLANICVVYSRGLGVLLFEGSLVIAVTLGINIVWTSALKCKEQILEFQNRCYGAPSLGATR